MSQKIESLTPEQEAKIPEYLDEYLKIGLSIEKSDREKAEAAIKAAYTYYNMPAENLKFMWVDSPFVGAVKAAQHLKGSTDVTDKEVQDQAGMANYGSFEAYWVSFYAFIAEQLPVEKDNLIDITKDIVKNCGVFWTFEDAVIISEKPVAIHMKDKKLHNENGLALEYPNGDGIFALDGVRYNSMLEMVIDKAASQN